MTAIILGGLRPGIWSAIFLFHCASPGADLTTPLAPRGEPYQLNGSRIVFTNWTFVRAGGVGWLDREGKPAWATTDYKLDREEGTWNPEPYNPWGIRIRAHAPSELRKMEIEPEFPWESRQLAIDSIVEDGGIYKAWGSCGAPCYLESKDGLSWERPKLGLVEHAGSKENNLIPSGPHGQVFIDPTSDSERYKCVYEGSISAEEFEKYRARRPDAWSSVAQRIINDETRYWCLKGSVSPDGFHWDELPDPLVVEHCDTLNVGWYDPRRACYTAYVRTWNPLPRAPSIRSSRWDSWLGHARRSIGITRSRDFRNFPLPRTLLETGPELPPTIGLYTNCFTWIPKAPECLLMFPALYDLNDDTTSIRLASSSDGEVWNWIGDEPLMRTAPFGQWDGGCIFASPPLLELGDGSFALRYFGSDVPHKYPRGLMKTGWGYAIWPKGRLIGLEAEERGEFATVAVIPKGNRLHLNVNTKRAGKVLVAAQTGRHRGPILEGRSFEDCVPIVGDHVRVPVRWKDHEDLGLAPGEPVILLFKMERAELFALEFE
ncbi:MAG: hypothetical protein HUU16_14080 [Candidatus Omnitrophica bacterium]|nr:hypothetical protein [Candidatus Omnitrophota bacterium]